MSRPRSETPDTWAGAIKAGEKVYYKFVEHESVPLIYHWCEAGGHWLEQTATKHTVVNREPLELSPSLYWSDCCGLHGFIRNGVWTDA